MRDKAFHFFDIFIHQFLNTAARVRRKIAHRDTAEMFHYIQPVTIQRIKGNCMTTGAA